MFFFRLLLTIFCLVLPCSPAFPFQVQPDTVTDGNGKTWSFVYDQWGNIHQITDPRGVVTAYTWGYPTGGVPDVINSVTDSSTSFTMGELLSVQEGSLTPVSYAYYEPSGLVQNVTYAAPGFINDPPDTPQTVQESFTYNTNGDIATITQPNNNATTSGITTTFTYYANPSSSIPYEGEVETITDNLGHSSGFTYTSDGDLYQATDALNHTTAYQYDLADQVTTETYPATGMSGAGQASTAYGYLYTGGPCTGWTRYNESSSPVAYASYGRDANGFVTNVSGTVTPVSYGYDADYRLKEIVDGESNETSYHYNAQGYLYQVYYPGVANGHSDGANSPGSADTVSYTSYDDDGNPLTRVDGNDVTTSYTYGDPESLLTNVSYNDGKTPSVTLGYDTYGRMESITDGTGSTSSTLDDDDNVTEEDTDFTGLGTKKLIYSYNPDGSRSEMSTPAGSFSYQYDAAQRLVSLTNPYDQTTSWSYYDNDWLETQTLSPGSVTTYTPDAWGELTSLVNASSTPTQLSDATVNSSGSPQSFTLHPQVNQGDTIDFSVGALGGSMNNDSTGLQADVSTPASRTWSFSYDDLDRASTVTMTDTMPDQSTNRSMSTYSTDYDGHRISKTVSGQATGNGTTYYVYDGDTLVEEIAPSGTTYELPGVGYVSNSSGTFTQYYSFDNAEGSTLSTVNDAGALQSRNEYDGYGITYPEFAGAQSDFRFVGSKGYVTDDDTGLDMLGHRFYIPQLGRFLNQDPIGAKGGLNLYEYAGDNPVTGVDPTGTEDDENGEDATGILNDYADAERDEEFSDPEKDAKRAEVEEKIEEFLPPVIPESIKENIDRQEAIDALFRAGYGPQEINEIVHAFDGPISVEETEEPTVGYRYTSSPQERPGRWYSPKPYVRPGNARRYLALPDENTAENEGTYLIPPGKTVLIGKVAEQKSFGPHAAGHGDQIFVLNTSGISKLPD